MDKCLECVHYRRVYWEQGHLDRCLRNEEEIDPYGKACKSFDRRRDR